VIWKKADFLNGADAQSISFGNTTDISNDRIELVTGAPASFLGDTLRWWVQSDGVKYISDTDLTLASGVLASTTYSTTDFSAQTWRSQPLVNNSAVGMFVDSGFPGGIASSALTNITAIGFYIDDANAPLAANALITRFEISAIPEPSTFLSVGLRPDDVISSSPPLN
jgi:hypothetical protein